MFFESVPLFVHSFIMRLRKKYILFRIGMPSNYLLKPKK